MQREADMETEARTGGCQCGAVVYEVEGEPLLVSFCHCTMCRRAHAAPVVAWAMFKEQKLRYTKGTAAHYASSPEARRWFCGAQLVFTASYMRGTRRHHGRQPRSPGGRDPDPPLLDAKRLPWMKHADGLPVYPEFPPTG